MRFFAVIVISLAIAKAASESIGHRIGRHIDKALSNNQDGAHHAMNGKRANQDGDNDAASLQMDLASDHLHAAQRHAKAASDHLQTTIQGIEDGTIKVVGDGLEAAGAYDVLCKVYAAVEKYLRPVIVRNLKIVKTWAKDVADGLLIGTTEADAALAEDIGVSAVESGEGVGAAEVLGKAAVCIVGTLFENPEFCARGAMSLDATPVLQNLTHVFEDASLPRSQLKNWGRPGGLPALVMCLVLVISAAIAYSFKLPQVQFFASTSQIPPAAQEPLLQVAV